MLALEYTRFGAMVRAAVDNQRMARGLGINVERTFAVTFALGSGLAGLGGALAIEIVGLDPNFAFALPGLRADRRLGRRARLDRRLVRRRDPDRHQRHRRQVLRARTRRLLHLSRDGRRADVAAARACSGSADDVGQPPRHPASLSRRRQSRWHPLEIVFWLATLLPFVLFPDYLSLASQIAITALFALSLDLILGYAGMVSLGHAAFFGIGAYAAGIFSKFVLGRAADRPAGRRAAGRARRLRDELHRRARPASGPDHDHARHRPARCTKSPTRALADRRHRQPAGHQHRQVLGVFRFDL